MIRAAVGIYVSGSQSRHQEHRRHIFLRCQETCTTTAVGLYNSRRGSHQRRTYLHRVVAAVFPPADKRHKLHTPSFSATKVEGNEGCLDWVTGFQSMSVAVSRLLARERLAHNDWVDNAGDALWFLPRPGRPSPSPSSLCRCTYGSVPIFYGARTAGSRAGSIGCRCLMRDADLKSHRVNLPRKQVLKWVLFFLAHTCVRHQLQTA